MFKKLNKTSGIYENEKVHPEIVNSYSQYGEDLIIDGIIGNKTNGFFIDVGANDPIILNNTKRFYDRGWTGINIEPNPFLFKNIIDCRHRDINLNVGIGSQEQILPFYVLSADTLSTFDRQSAERNYRDLGERIVKTIHIQTLPLLKIFETYAKDQIVDFISIDVEGYELEVLKSNNWKRYRPYLLVIEITPRAIDIIPFLKDQGYELVFKNSGSVEILIAH
jgi:FkbM family methyltransferase